MTEKAIDFGIEIALQNLGIKKENLGTSTGSNWFSNGEKIESFSPTDGKFIATVQASTKEDYYARSFVKINRVLKD